VLGNTMLFKPEWKNQADWMIRPTRDMHEAGISDAP